MRITIVTPTFNQAAYLPRMARSVLDQEGDFELRWIVIDGVSTDGALDYLRSLSDPRLTLVSEPDRGQAHAINKGMALADGDIVAWLNSDDLYVPGALQTVHESFARYPAAQWLAGFCQIIDSRGQAMRSVVSRYKERSLRRYRYRSLLRENFISQPAVFWRRRFSEEIGPLDEALHWTMDYDLWLRMGKRSDPLIVARVLARFRLHEGSKSGDFKRRQFDEEYDVARRYLGSDHVSAILHRMNVEKIVWAYRAMRWLGM